MKLSETDKKILDSYNPMIGGLGADFPMGTADTDFRMLDEVKKALHDKIDQGILSYCSDEGYFLEAFANYQNRHYNLAIQPEEVFPGTDLMAVYKVLLDAYTSPGDGIIVQTPTFGHLHHVPKITDVSCTRTG